MLPAEKKTAWQQTIQQHFKDFSKKIIFSDEAHFHLDGCPVVIIKIGWGSENAKQPEKQSNYFVIYLFVNLINLNIFFSHI
jgi:hypothetical protein